MPFVTIRIVKQAIEPNAELKKQQVAAKVAAVLAEVTGLPPSEVWTVFEEVEAKNWYLGDQNVHSLRFDGD